MRLQGFRCFECNGAAHHAHHVIPFSQGGTRTVPLCESCHSKVHGLDMSDHSRLTKEGLKRARAAGKRVGRPRKPMPEAEILADFQAGVSIKELAVKFEASRIMIWRICAGVR
jgi:hypothetical protein